MNGLINLSKSAPRQGFNIGEVDFVASLAIAIGFVTAVLFAFTTGLPGGAA
ncbi:MAG: hypothetical protein SGJ21_10915 [Alphaproteobacteria bacterium]|nr:hypothetical protein [Alphaproteobacteria bacterium]